MNALILPTININQKNITMDQLDIDTISRLRYPVGSSYISFDPNLDPNNFLYGTWEILAPYGLHSVRMAIECHHGGFVHHDFIVTDDNRVSRAEVDSKFLLERKEV